MKIAYATDLHGYRGLYESFLEEKADVYIIGGDIGPNYVIGTEEELDALSNQEYFEKMMINERDFLKRYLVPRIDEFRKEHKSKVYIMFGNDDFYCNLDLLEEAESKGILRLLYDKKNEKPKFHKLSKDVFIAGYPYVPLTPFTIKDWEKFDMDEEPKREFSLEGYKSYRDYSGIYVNKERLYETREDNIANDLEKIASNAGKEKISKTIFVMHCPPFNMHDKIMPKIEENKRVMAMIEEYSRMPEEKGIKKDKAGIKEFTEKCNQELRKTKPVSTGSLAIREFIEKYQPLLTLHGHIHQSYRLTGEYKQNIGRTICVNPGTGINRKTGKHKLYAVLFDSGNLSDMDIAVKKAKETEEKPKGP